MFLEQSIMDLKGVGEQTIKKFNKLGLFTIEHLLEHYPKEYEDRQQTVNIQDIMMDEKNNILAKVVSKPEVMKKGYKVIVKFRVKDDTGSIYVVFYGQPYMKNNFIIGETYHFYGKIRRQYGYIEMESPEYEKIHSEALQQVNKIIPVYPSTKKLSQKVIRQLIEQALSLALPEVEDVLPTSIKQAYGLKSKQYALTHIHFPESNEAFFEARKRLVFEELFLLQLSLLMMKSEFLSRSQGISKKVPEEFKAFIQSLPFELTNAQKKVVKEIVKDLKSPYAGNRLVQGDVGSGKTVLAAISLFIVIKNHKQGALMAPTEVLAKQHYEFLEQVLEPFNIKIALLTGSTTGKEKKRILEELKQKKIDLIVGTHALIEDQVEIPALGLVITDEQHRFGVRQRLKLSSKGEMPDVMVMTATPIPRTLALILYGDMDISVIDELPPGRQPIKTNAVDSSYHARIYRFMEKHIQEERQCYVICPMVEENEKQTDLKSVVEYTNYLKEEIFPHFKIGLLHGKMKPKEKNAVMEDFAKGELNILVSTTVVEVGVNVPNATVMVIENAERFGLAQLHQLRGRVGRGKHQSYCVLVSDSKNKITKKRLKIMEESTDGFVIADTDLKLRGPGDFFGTKQHGLPEMKIANLYTDAKVLKEAQKAAKRLLEIDPTLVCQEHQRLKIKLLQTIEGKQMHTAL